MSTDGSFLKGTYVIADWPTLRAFDEHTRRIVGRGAYHSIRVLTPIQNREWVERRLNRAYRTCGCLAAGMTVITALAVLAMLHVFYQGWAMPTGRQIGLAIGVIVVSAAVGKLCGILRAHITLRMLIAKLCQGMDGIERRESK